MNIQDCFGCATIRPTLCVRLVGERGRFDWHSAAVEVSLWFVLILALGFVR